MHVEQKNEGATPFQEKCNTEQFFVGGGRGAILSDIKAALQGKVDLVTVIGEEGSGKTMLCKMLQEQWDTHHKILFLPKIVESFEDVVRVAAQECNLQYPADTNRADAKKIFLNLIITLRARGESLLLVCDEAEKMYLATLERIRKILDDVNAQGGGLQLLLAGRKSLGGNLEQLALCDFERISEKQFFLSALDDNETWSYLNFCVQGIRGNDQKEVFTREAAAKIASLGRGNLRLINVYADESLQSSNAETSFLVLLDHVKDDGSDADLLLSTPGFLSQLPCPPRYLLGGCAVFSVLLLLLMMFVFRGDDEKKSLELSVEQESSPLFATSVMEARAPVQEVKEETVLEFSPDVVEEVAEPKRVQAEPEENVVESVDTEEIIGAVAVEIPGSESEIVHLQEMELVETVAPVFDEPQIPVQHTPVEISPVEIVERIETDAEVPELVTQSKISADKNKRLVSTRIASSQTKKVSGKPALSSKTTAVTPETPKDPVLGRFFTAGEKWQAGEMDSSFSIQLMALKSDQAEENLKRIVSQPDYQAVADKLVMLKRPSDPPVVLVFYGVYPTMPAARNARNNMPIFLRDRHPYPVSVRGAVEKARVE
jgi:type II secretory pathway predicted ATPase ExeA/septal ring-binding cell division protein DamX